MISTRRRLQYAAGFLELDMEREAARELRAIPRAEQRTPLVLSARISLHMHAKQWKSVIAAARALARLAPGDDKGWISWAFALRELGDVAGAKRVLLEALPLHGQSCEVLYYNLACYECLLGNLAEAKRALVVAAKRDAHWKESALSDPDLEKLWPEIKALAL